MWTEVLGKWCILLPFPPWIQANCITNLIHSVEWFIDVVRCTTSGRAMMIPSTCYKMPATSLPKNLWKNPKYSIVQLSYFLWITICNNHFSALDILSKKSRNDCLKYPIESPHSLIRQIGTRKCETFAINVTSCSN